MPRIHVALSIRIVMIIVLAFGALATVSSLSPASPAVAKEGKGGGEGRGGPKKDERGKGKSDHGKSGSNDRGSGKGKGKRAESDKENERGGNEGRGHRESRVEVVAIVTYGPDLEVTPTASPTTVTQPTTSAQQAPPPTPAEVVTSGTATVEATTELTDTTGSIVVEHFDCPIATVQSGYDWFGQCEPAGEGGRFRLVPDVEDPTDSLRAVTDAGGHARFSQLAPGVYVLTQLESDWCHAKSDGVDEQGNVVVTAGERTTVWAFSCQDDASSPTPAP